MNDAIAHQALHLEISGLHAWYGESHVLHGMDLNIRKGETATLLGRNGAGKSTTLKSIMGMVGRLEGSIRLEGRELIGLPPEKIAGAGVGYCPEDRGIYASLNVDENLLLPRVFREGGMKAEEIYALFPNLWERRMSQGSKLSGGEQQMLAIARILRTGAPVLLLDEPTEGLAPVIVQEIGRLIRSFKDKGYTTLLVEQNLNLATTVADRHHVVENGRVVDVVDRAHVAANRAMLERHLGV